MSATRELLAHLLIGSDLRARESARSISDTQGWSDAVKSAAAWRVAPRLFSQIRRLELDVPETPAFELRRCFIAAYSRSAFLASKGIAAIHHLEAAGIRIAAFKGLASMARLHAGPQWRSMNDVDLLVSEQDLQPAVLCLESHGFMRHVDVPLGQYAAFVANSPAFAGNKAITLRGTGECEIDLHWAVGNGLDTAGILDRTETARMGDAEFPAVSAEDGALLTARHAAREDFQIEGVCRDLIDAKLWFALLARQDRLASLAQHAAGAGMTSLLLAVAQIVKLYDPESAAAEVLAAAASAREKRASAKLVELFRLQVREGPLGKDLVYLAHPTPVRQIVSGLAANPHGYRRLMRAFETHVLGQPLPWMKRAVGLAGSVYKLGPRRFQFIRALARAKYD